MKDGPDVARVAALVGDPARANMLTALMTSQALSASELAEEAGVTLPTASSHLAKLEAGGLVTPQRQGRHRYFRLAGSDVASALEALMGLAARAGHVRIRPGPKDPALRRARVCYDHLAGDLGVQLLDSLISRSLIIERQEALHLSPAGERFVTAFGIDLAAVRKTRRPTCKACLDWSARRNHLAGALGAALLDRLYALGWARRETGTRVVGFSARGEGAFDAWFGPRAAPLAT
jgi:DNA-binding transcriptional ArsR family regulator